MRRAHHSGTVAKAILVEILGQMAPQDCGTESAARKSLLTEGATNSAVPEVTLCARPKLPSSDILRKKRSVSESIGLRQACRLIVIQNMNGGNSLFVSTVWLSRHPNNRENIRTLKGRL